MINRIISFSVHNKLLIGLFTIVLVIAGIYSITKVPLDAVPDITNNQVQVITLAPNLGTEDIEQFVTYPVELAMANLPGVVEIRSISRFGLSVVTIVFEDNQGTYLPRQLVGEKLVQVRENIPEGFGHPSMGPISTGLGEIYQYTLKVNDEFKHRYTPQDLRTMQDWIVSRQMAMVPGVVEINAIGGNIKQYEVAISPDEMNAIGVTIFEIYEALEKNNQNTGGAYIEKNHQANFIRGEGLARSIKDLENIIVKNENGIPIMIKDVAKVKLGSAIRYGALTQNGEGEAVGGLVMMLKGANSNDVIERVKDRMEEIQNSLPEGVTIEPLLDRSKLISQTTSTVSTNLIEGALIVIFVLVFLLGNVRGGLIVASTIPLSLLFAFILMNVFDVWANLMSLGAIDFGIIVDGAVIIVESTVFLIHEKIIKGRRITRGDLDKITLQSSSSMMRSAFFGQLIILIVFIPILALEGIEGKMFKPMAMTFMFAMIGVMVLCLTYVPMMSAKFLNMKKNKKNSLGDRLIDRIEAKYVRLLLKVQMKGKWIIGLTILMLSLSIYLFQNMGGEFVPQLEEGDLAFHAILKPGSSLEETIKTTTEIENIVKTNFPEVENIVSRIGVAEVPTDPMPFDFADIFVILKPISEWESAKTKDELAEKMKEALQVLPGINYEFTQPIEMRFNELLEGIREDIAIKLYGDDIYLLASKAEEVSEIIAGTHGIGDMRVEATTGLPQMTVQYNRHKLAQYGLNVYDLNTVIQTAFAGGKAGVIFEGEKRFDLVVRLDELHRQSINDLKNLFINVPGKSQIPLKEVAEINYRPGPMQISRDNTNRRTYVGINVRGRDIKSLVEELKTKISRELDLPPGYYIRYGGAFENLKRASDRLKIVVPIALGLIFLLIFFALRSIKQTIMIYVAIPLAAIGGVLSLWIRDMPFSISAGIGFIVLFGVAVLNGLVLISGWNELKKEGFGSVQERTLQGAKRRIRPILLTALTDILGFMPMAISTSAGAEVQRPLATVVIGGMISATFLTLFILPLLYGWLENGRFKLRASKVQIIGLPLLILTIFSFKSSEGQINDKRLITSLDDAIEIGLHNNGNILVAKSNIRTYEESKKRAYSIDKTDFDVQYGQYNSQENDLAFEINQQFEFPSVYTAQRKLANEEVKGSEIQLKVVQNQIKRGIKKSWYQLAYLIEKEELLKYQDSIYSEFLRSANLRYETQETSFLEKANAESRVMKIENEMKLLKSDIEIQADQLRILLNDTIGLYFIPTLLVERELVESVDTALIFANPSLELKKQQIKIEQARKSVFSSKRLPDFTIGYFNQSMNGTMLSNSELANNSNRFTGFQAGISIPIFYGSYASEVRISKIRTQIAETQATYVEHVIDKRYRQRFQEVNKYRNSLDYYQNQAVPQANLIIKNAQKSFTAGSINYIEYVQNINQAINLKYEYLETLNQYNQSIIEIEYLTGK